MRIDPLGRARWVDAVVNLVLALGEVEALMPVSQDVARMLAPAQVWTNGRNSIIVSGRACGTKCYRVLIMTRLAPGVEAPGSAVQEAERVAAERQQAGASIGWKCIEIQRKGELLPAEDAVHPSCGWTSGHDRRGGGIVGRRGSSGVPLGGEAD